MITSKKGLEMALEKVEGFVKPKISLEQYRLPAPAAAEILWYVGLRHRDIEGRVVADLGCGTGMLTVGAALMGADYAVGVDVDVEAIATARHCAGRMGVGGATDFVRSDVGGIGMGADIVIQNPPFGVRVREADRAFIMAGIRVAPTVYSLHRGGAEVRRFVMAFAEDCGGRVDEVLPLKIKLPPSYHFHKKRFYIFDADLYRIVRD